MPPIEIFPAIVRGHTGASPGPASGISYRLFIDFPDGGREVDGVRPAMDRYPDTIDVRAIKPSTAVLVASVQGVLQLIARELPDFGPCTTP